METDQPIQYVILTTPESEPENQIVANTKCESKSCSPWYTCPPVIFYLILVITTFILGLFANTSSQAKAWHMFIGFIWITLTTSLIVRLCRTGHRGWAWFIAAFWIILAIVWVILFFLGFFFVSIIDAL